MSKLMIHSPRVEPNTLCSPWWLEGTKGTCGVQTIIYTFIRLESTFSEDGVCYARLDLNQSHRNRFFLAEQEFKYFLF